MKPLVTIAVVTYNSSKYIIDTLESAKAQTYDNIELIVSDDCSTDNTVEISRKWIADNGNRFKRTELIPSTVNTGVSANVNRAYSASHGEWIKGIAGDDVLFPDSIEKYVDFIENNPNEKIVFGIRREFGDNVKYEIELSHKAVKKTSDFWELKTANDQYWDFVIRQPAIHSCAAFFHKDAFLKVGGFDETIPMCEDLPMWMRLTKAGFKLSLLPRETVLYRIHGDSIVHSKTKNGKNLKYNRVIFDVFTKYRYPALKDLDFYYAKTMYYLYLKKVSFNVKKFYCLALYLYFRACSFQFKRPIIRNTKKMKDLVSPSFILILKKHGYVE